MKIVKNDIEFKGEKYKAVIKEYSYASSTVELYKENKIFPCFKTNICGHIKELNYVKAIKEAFEEYSDRNYNQITLQEWDGKIE